MHANQSSLAAALGLGTLLLVASCRPTVQVEAPKEPIVINLNVKIEHEIRVKVDRDLDQLIAQDPELFGTGGGKP